MWGILAGTLNFCPTCRIYEHLVKLAIFAQVVIGSVGCLYVGVFEQFQYLPCLLSYISESGSFIPSVFWF